MEACYRQELLGSAPSLQLVRQSFCESIRMGYSVIPDSRLARYIESAETLTLMLASYIFHSFIV